MQMYTRLFTTGLLLFMLCAAAGCAENPLQPEKAPLRISLIPWPGWAHTYVAQEKGLFAKHGVEVKLVLEQTFTGQLKLYEHGEVDGTFTPLPDAIAWNAEGIPSKTVYVSDCSVTGDVIAGRPDIGSLAGLRDKRVSFERVNSFSHLFVLEALKQAGISEAEVHLVNLPAQEVPAALEKGTIDAGHTWEPFKSQLLSKGYRVLAYGRDVPGVLTEVLVFHEHVMKERQQDVCAVVAALLEARSYLYANRAESVAVMARSEGMTEAEVEACLAAIHHFDLAENVRAMKQSNSPLSLYTAADKIVQFYLERGQLADIPDAAAFIDPSCINALQEAVP